MKLNSTTNLLKQPIFWIVNMLLISTSIFVAVMIYRDGLYSWSLSVSGFKLFMNDFKFSIAISALIIPASALIATMHRSEQLSKQIELLMGQNNFANYYKHLEEFEKYLVKQYTKKVDIGVKGRENEIYRCFYGKARDGDYRPNPTLINSLELNARMAIDLTDEFLDKGGDFWEFHAKINPIFDDAVALTSLGYPSLSKGYFSGKPYNETLKDRNMPRAMYHLFEIYSDFFEDVLVILNFEMQLLTGCESMSEMVIKREDLKAKGVIFLSPQPELLRKQRL